MAASDVVAAVGHVAGGAPRVHRGHRPIPWAAACADIDAAVAVSTPAIWRRDDDQEDWWSAAEYFG